MNDEQRDEDLLPVEPESKTPHYDKLTELLRNHKLPESDRQSVEVAITRYREWVQTMDVLAIRGDQRVEALVNALNVYKRFIELELIWDSEADFLYRQRGQLKLDSSIIEEFLPRLVNPSIIPELEGREYEAGPRTTFSAAYFTTTFASPARGAGLEIRKKAQDFTVSRTAYLQSSLEASFRPEDTITHKLHLAFIAAECKTNLDKTMFQEAIATAHDLKIAVPGVRYYLMCEWLDMTPISTRATDIDEVLILRGKRLASNVRGRFATSSSRKEARGWYERFLRENPVRLDGVLRFARHLRSVFSASEPKEDDVLERGYF